MLKRTIALLVAATAVFFIPSGATNAAAPKAKLQAPPANVIQNLPAGWTTPVNISNTPDDESRNPVIAVDAQGKAYLTWVDWPGYVGAGGERNMMFNSNRSGQWPAESTVAAPLLYTAIDDSGFPTIAVNPAGSDIVVAYHDGDFSQMVMQVFYRECVNGTWGSVTNFSGTPVPSEYITLGFSPLDNTLFGIFMVDVSVPFELAMRYWDGQTGQIVSPDQINVMNGRSKYLYLTKVFAFDPTGTVHLTFTTHTEAWYSKNPTPKNFNTWTDAVNISGGTGLTDTDPRIAVDNDGEAYIVWQTIAGGSRDAKEIWFRKTVNKQWQDGINISNTSNDSDCPTIAVNPATKDIYVAWQEIVDGVSQVWLKSYEGPAGGTKTWGTPVNMSSGFGPSGEPFIVFDRLGNLHLAYVASINGGRFEIVYTVKQGANISLTSPNVGDSWQALTSHPITWTTVGTATNVKLEYSTDGGTNYTTIVASTPNTGSYAWTVPNTPSTTCVVRVSETTTGIPRGTSEVFTISPIFITVTSPTATDSWQALTSHSIAWTTTGTAANVKLEYSTDGGASYTAIVASTPNTGSYAWAVPNVPSTNCRVRVSEAATGVPTGTSPVFTISPIFITVTSPTATDSWEALTSHSITWTTTGTAANVKLEYSTDGGTSYTAIVASTPNTGSYTWTVPNTPSTNCRVRVSEAATGIPTGTSPVFTIVRPRVNPPVNLAVDSSLTAAEDRKTNSLAWAANSLNSGITVTNYKIYRKAAGAADSTFAYLDQVSGSTLVYTDSNLAAVARYAYRLTAVSSLGAESLPSDSVTDKAGAFAPVSVSVTAAVTKLLFYEIKDNAITFTASPNNAASDIGGYDVYRRKASESDSALTLLTSLDASTLSYTDARLRGVQKYAYALKTKFKDGRMSGFSAVVAEK